MLLTGLLLLAIAPPGFLYNQDPLSWGGTTHSSLGPPKPTGNKTIPHKHVTDLSDLGNPSTETPPSQVLSSTKVTIKANQDKVFISLISFLLIFIFEAMVIETIFLISCYCYIKRLLLSVC